MLLLKVTLNPNKVAKSQTFHVNSNVMKAAKIICVRRVFFASESHAQGRPLQVEQSKFPSKFGQKRNLLYALSISWPGLTGSQLLMRPSKGH